MARQAHSRVSATATIENPARLSVIRGTGRRATGATGSPIRAPEMRFFKDANSANYTLRVANGAGEIMFELRSHGDFFTEERQALLRSVCEAAFGVPAASASDERQDRRGTWPGAGARRHVEETVQPVTTMIGYLAHPETYSADIPRAPVVPAFMGEHAMFLAQQIEPGGSAVITTVGCDDSVYVARYRQTAIAALTTTIRRLYEGMAGAVRPSRLHRAGWTYWERTVGPILFETYRVSCVEREPDGPAVVIVREWLGKDETVFTGSLHDSLAWCEALLSVWSPATALGYPSRSETPG